MNLSMAINLSKTLRRQLAFMVVLPLITVISACSGVTDAADNDLTRDMTKEEARKLIDSGESLETISKSTWQDLLSPQEYKVLWEKGTERPFTGELLSNKGVGTYVSAGCQIPVFRSEHKFKSGTGWPSFWEVLNKDNVILKKDVSWGMTRVEILSKCGEHLGHVFEDGPAPTGLRYCINSAALKFVSDE